MNTTYVTLTELNQYLAICHVTEAQLCTLGFTTTSTKDLKADDFSEQQWRKYRNARLYKREDLPKIRAALAIDLTTVN